MSSGIYQVNIYQGSSFSISLQVKDVLGQPINLSGYNVSGNLKYRYGDSIPLAPFQITKIEPYESGYLSVELSDEVTATLPITVAPFDIELYYSGGETYKALRGRASIVPEVTI